ncbi:MAG: hypothetical protein H6706_19760 [Myxococcales bacterium]|nr:hypothetical protein [Myxococcales bacterium]
MRSLAKAAIGLVLVSGNPAWSGEGEVQPFALTFTPGDVLRASALEALKTWFTTESERLALEALRRAKAAAALSICYTFAQRAGTANTSVDAINMLPGENGDGACRRFRDLDRAPCEAVVGLYLASPDAGAHYEATIWTCDTQTPAGDSLGQDAVFACCNR